VPTYQYACTECGHEFDAVQSFSDDALTECPACSGRLRKVFGNVGIVFKGSGFYRNDSRDKQPAATETKTDGKVDAKSDGKADSKTESKKSEAAASSASKDSGSKDSGSKDSGKAKPASTSSKGSSTTGSAA
jgi:putative FmdB family regulatory protein